MMLNSILKLVLPAVIFTAESLMAQSPGSIPDKPEVIFVAGGSFQMGNNSGKSDDKPVHTVTVSSFSIGKYEVTVGQYKAFCNATGRSMPDPPYWGWQDKHPMVYLSYADAVSYCNWLSKQYGGNWRLPTEAEWEFAARGGNQSKGSTYPGGNEIAELAWFTDNAGEQSQAVGLKKPNDLGLYDMSGNAFEFCSDWYGPYSSETQNSPLGPSSGTKRVIRGGCFMSSAAGCGIAFRTSHLADYSDDHGYLGFRVVLSQ